ncbi:hypothetical protein MHM98_11620 [Psychrobium sp. MM17-31]|uniref:hypothetical protein n=1 Tax=Psychrobium sp. MM17-31 TaxID=2917758 RepID=UPI001EF44A6C|nr:hypothetical protein [Psychrobium sp. MM17-31]MCG7531984.1 hypothetical protein [Psychrobium sp. MM17-31]
MQKKYILSAVSMALFSVSALADNQWRFETSLSSYSNSEVMSIKALADDTWDGKYQDADSLFTTNRADMGVGYGNWLFGGAIRYDYFGHFTKDTGRFFYLDKNKLPQPDNTDLDILLDVEHTYASGPFIEYSNSYQSLDYRIRLNYWQSDQVLSGKVHGKVNTATNELYLGQLDFDYYYDEDTIFDRETPDTMYGDGYSLDIGLFWQIDPEFDVSLDVMDIGYSLNWDRVYHTEAKLIRGEAKKNSEPSLSGIENDLDYKQKFDSQIFLQAGYQTDYGRAFIGNDYINSTHHWYSGFQVPVFGDLAKASITLYPETKAIKLGLEGEMIGINLGLNKSKISDTNTLILNMYFKY